MLRYFVLLQCEVKTNDTACCATLWYWSVKWQKRHCMLQYFVILKCEVGKKTPHASLLCDTEVWSVKTKRDTAWYWSVNCWKKGTAAVLCDTEVWSDKNRHCMLPYFVILQCEVKTKTLHAGTDGTLWYWSVKWTKKTTASAELCDTEVCSGKHRPCMLRCFVILKCEVNKQRHRMLRYFVILKYVVGGGRHYMLRYFVMLKC